MTLICLFFYMGSGLVSAKQDASKSLVSVAVMPLQNKTGYKELDWLSVAVYRMMEIQLLTAKGVDVQWFEHRLPSLTKACSEFKRDCIAYQSPKQWKTQITSNLPDVFVAGSYKKSKNIIKVNLAWQSLDHKAKTISQNINLKQLESDVTKLVQKIYTSIKPNANYPGLKGQKKRKLYHPDAYKLYAGFSVLATVKEKAEIEHPRAAEWGLEMDKLLKSTMLDNAELITNPYMMMDFLLKHINKVWAEERHSMKPDSSQDKWISSVSYLINDALLPWLIRRVNDGDEYSRHMSARRLMMLANKSTIPVLKKKSKDTDPQISIPAIVALLRLVDIAKHNRVLKSALAHESSEVKQHVLKLMIYDPENIPLIISATNSKDESVRRAGLRALQSSVLQLNHDDISLWLNGDLTKLHGVYGLHDDESQKALFDVLMSMATKESVKKAVSQVKKGNVQIKHYAAGHLYRYPGSDDKFEFLLYENELSVRRLAAEYFIKSSNEKIHKKSIEILVAAVASSQSEDKKRESLINKLKKLSDSQVLDLFMTLAKSVKADERIEAVGVLGNHLENKKIASVFLALVLDQNVKVAKVALRRLRRMIYHVSDKAGMRLANWLMKNFNKVHDSHARKKIINIVLETENSISSDRDDNKKHERKIHRWLIENLKHDDVEVRVLAIDWLTKDKKPGKEMLPEILELLSYENVRIRKTVTNMFPYLVDKEIANSFIKKYLLEPKLITEQVVGLLYTYTLHGKVDVDLADKLLISAMRSKFINVRKKAIYIATTIGVREPAYHQFLIMLTENKASRGKLVKQQDNKKAGERELRDYDIALASAVVKMYEQKHHEKLYRAYKQANRETQYKLLSVCRATSCQSNAISSFIIETVKKEKDKKYKKAALEALHKFEPTTEIETLLLHELKQGSVGHKVFVIDNMLSQYTSDRVVNALLKYTSVKNPILRRSVLDALDKNKTSEKVVPTLRKMLFDESQEIRAEAAANLGIRGARIALPDIIRSLDTFGVNERSQDEYKGAMILVSPSDLDKLLPLVKHKNTLVREIVVNVISESYFMYPEAKELLLLMLDDSFSYIRLTALRGLQRVGSDDVFHSVVRLTTDKSPLVQLQAVKTLVNMKGSRALPVVEKFISSSSPGLRNEAARVIGQLGDKADLHKLVPLLSDKEWYVRTAAIEVISKSDNEDILAKVRQLMKDKNKQVSFMATMSLAKRGDMEARKNIKERVNKILQGKSSYTPGHSSEDLATLLIEIGEIPPYASLNEYKNKSNTSKRKGRREDKLYSALLEAPVEQRLENLYQALLNGYSIDTKVINKIINSSGKKAPLFFIDKIKNSSDDKTIRLSLFFLDEALDEILLSAADKIEPVLLDLLPKYQQRIFVFLIYQRDEPLNENGLSNRVVAFPKLSKALLNSSRQNIQDGTPEQQVKACNVMMALKLSKDDTSQLRSWVNNHHQLANKCLLSVRHYSGRYDFHLRWAIKLLESGDFLLADGRFNQLLPFRLLGDYGNSSHIEQVIKGIYKINENNPGSHTIFDAYEAVFKLSGKKGLPAVFKKLINRSVFIDPVSKALSNTVIRRDYLKVTSRTELEKLASGMPEFKRNILLERVFGKRSNKPSSYHYGSCKGKNCTQALLLDLHYVTNNEGYANKLKLIEKLFWLDARQAEELKDPLTTVNNLSDKKIAKALVNNPYFQYFNARYQRERGHSKSALKSINKLIKNTKNNQNIPLQVVSHWLKAELLWKLNRSKLAIKEIELLENKLLPRINVFDKENSKLPFNSFSYALQGMIQLQLKQNAEGVKTLYQAEKLLDSENQLDKNNRERIRGIVLAFRAKLQSEGEKQDADKAIAISESRQNANRLEREAEELAIMTRLEASIGEGDYEMAHRLTEKLALKRQALAARMDIKSASPLRSQAFDSVRKMQDQVSQLEQQYLEVENQQASLKKQLKNEQNKTEQKNLKAALAGEQPVKQQTDINASKELAQANAKLKKLRKQRMKQRRDLKKFVVGLKRSHPEIATLASAEPAELSKLQDRLTDKQVIVQYLFLPEKSYVFLISIDDINLVELNIKRDELTQWVRDFRLGLAGNAASRGLSISNSTSNKKSNFKKTSQLLYKNLIQPIKGQLSEKQHLILVPNGALHLLPFAALKWKEGYLVEKFDISILGNATLMTLNRQKEHKERKLYAIANPINANWSRLAGAEQEVKNIQRYFSKAQLNIGKDALAAEIREKDLRGWNLHFATHGEAGSLETTRLIFSDGYLSINDIWGLYLDGAPLVVLSACETGLGEQLAGDEVVSLSNGFLFAGAKSVVSSLWKVPDQSTQQLMEAFYANLDNKNIHSRATALSKAQRQQIAMNKKPYDWAGFIITGN